MPKVLIVDDEEDILWGLSEELTRNGIEVDTSSNGQEAFEKIKENDYDFLITDIRMPGMSGSELLLKSRNLRPDLKVIVMTAYGSDELKQEVLSHGAISYLEKPFDFEQLLELIKEKSKKVDETISKLSLNQFMQLVSMEGQSCTITVKTDEGEGKVYFVDGEVVNAEFQNSVGEEAFIKIMKFQKPSFNVDWNVPQTKRMIEKPLHALLLAAVAKKEEEEAGVSESVEAINEGEVDLSALSKLFGEDEGVAEEARKETEAEKEEKVVEAPMAPEGSKEEMGIELEGISFEDEGVVEEEEAQEEVVSPEEKAGEEEEFSLDKMESMLEEEVAEEEEKEEVPLEEKVETSKEEQEAEKEEELEEEFSLENLESMLEEEVAEEEGKEEISEEHEKMVEEPKEKEEVKESLESLEEKLGELVEEPVEAQVEEPVKEDKVEEVKESEKVLEEVSEMVEKKEEVEQKVSETSVRKKGAPVVPEEKRPAAEEILRKIVALTTDIHAGFIADINGNIVASQYRTGSVKGDDLGDLGEYVGMVFEIIKKVTGEEIEDITLSLKNENIIVAPAMDGNLAVFVVTTKRTMKLALIKVQLKKAVASLKEKLS